jgi:hypothetical protein
VEYCQGADDQSLQGPAKNAYYDVFYNPWKPLSSLKRFELRPADGEGPVFAVDMTDGHFEVDEVPFFQHNTVKQDKETGNQAAIALRNFELIYARITNVHATTDPVNRQLIPTGMEVAGYIIGFRADDQDGEPHTHILRV